MAETAVQVEPVDARPGNEAIDRLEEYDWLVAASAKGVAALTRRLRAKGMGGLPKGLRVAAVGPATAAALLEAGTAVELVAGTASSDGLADSLEPRLGAGTRVLVVCPEGAPGRLAARLREAGAAVDEAPLYRTIPAKHAGELADAAIAGAFSAVVFTAPSSLTCWLDAAASRREALVRALKGAARVAIGPTTAARLLSAGLPADVIASAPSEDAVGVAIEQALDFDLLR